MVTLLVAQHSTDASISYLNNCAPCESKDK